MFKTLDFVLDAENLKLKHGINRTLGNRHPFFATKTSS